MPKAKTRVKKLEEMTGDEKAAYLKKSEAAKAEYQAKLQLQDAQDRLEEVKAAQGRHKTLKAEEREITKAVKDGSLTIEAAEKRIRAITGGSLQAKGIQATDFPEDEATAMLERVKAAQSKATASPAARASKVVAPTFTLTHTLLNVSKSQLLPPTDGGRPDATLSSLMAQYTMVNPLLVTTDFATAQGAGVYRLIDGSRRYHLLPEIEEGKPVPTYPAVLVTGFPDELTLEAAAAAINRGRSLNVLKLADTITRMRAAGKNDADIRRAIGLKTGEVEKYANTLSNVPEVIRAAVTRGAVSPATLLEVGKLPRAVAERLAVDYAKKLSEDKEARLTEADVDTARQGATREVVARDASTLNAAAATVPDAPSSAQDGSGAAGTAVEPSSPAPAAPEAPEAQPSPSPAPAETPGKELDTPTGDGGTLPAAGSAGGQAQAPSGATEPPAWVEGAFEKLGNVVAALPQDAPQGVIESYLDLRAALSETFGEGADELAAYPEDTPPSTYKPSKGAEVENTTGSRPGWKPVASKAVAALMSAIPAEAGERVWTAYKEFKASVAGAKTTA